jgi:hypothetical protein
LKTLIPVKGITRKLILLIIAAIVLNN